MSKEERRGLFRIDDEVTLQVRKIVSTELSGAPDARSASHSLLANELERMKAESRIYLRHVEKDSPEIARYFAHLEEKIDLIARTIIIDLGDMASKETQPVNISGSGMSFQGDEAFEVSEEVDVTFVLHPTFMIVNTQARVMACEQDEQGCRIAIEFKGLSDDDRDLLIRHVIKKQMIDIRDKKP